MTKLPFFYLPNSRDDALQESMVVEVLVKDNPADGSGVGDVVDVVVRGITLMYSRNNKLKIKMNSLHADVAPEPARKSKRISGFQVEDTSINRIMKEAKKRKPLKVDLVFEGASVENIPKKKCTKHLDGDKVDDVSQVSDDSLKTTQDLII